MMAAIRSRTHRTALRVYTALVPHRLGVRVLIDWALLLGSMALAVVLRYDIEVPPGTWAHLRWAFPLAAGVQLVVGLLTGLYLGRWKLGGFEEIGALLRTVLVTAAVCSLVNAASRPLPGTAPVITAVVALIAMAGVRYGWRLLRERRRHPVPEPARRLVVFGAGEAGTQVIASLLHDPDTPYLPVALLDDDPRKQNLRVRGVPVRGTRAALAEVARDLRADTLLIAVASGDGDLVRDLTRRAGEAGLQVTVLPPVRELFDGRVGGSDIRPVTEADLLGRHEIRTDLRAIAGYLSGRRVLVTGAGGSIGSELCRQITRFGPASLVMLDRDESGLHETQLSIEGRALLDSGSLVVCDIRDEAGLARVFAEHRPQVVFHAAALKHLTLLERHPREAAKTNVLGTRNVLAAAEAFGAERVVNISTDKAADPCCVLGWSKRITERLTAAADERAAGTYLSVRFGNVLGSRGSVLTAFRAQVARGGPVTVTHPDVTRFFMTIEEAVQLVVQAGAVGRGGDILVLDMGHPVRILDVARRLVDQAERRCEIVFTGLRPGEKLHEELFGDHEARELTDHPLISRVMAPPLGESALEDLDLDDDDDVVIKTMRDLSERPSGHRTSSEWSSTETPIETLASGACS